MSGKEYYDKKKYAKAIQAWEQEFKDNPYLESGYSGLGNLILEAATQSSGKSKLESIDGLNLPLYYKHLLKALTYYSQGTYMSAIQHYNEVFEILERETNNQPITTNNIYYLKTLSWEYIGHSYARQYLQSPTSQLINQAKEAYGKSREIAKLAGEITYGGRCYHTANSYLSIAKHLKSTGQIKEAYLLAEEAKKFVEEALSIGDAYYYYQTLATYYANFAETSQKQLESLRQSSLGCTEDNDARNAINEFYNQLIKSIIREKQMLEKQQQRITELEYTIEALQKAFAEVNSKIKTEQQIFNDVLLNAAKTGNLKKVNSVLDFDVDIKAKNEKGQTAFHLAVINGHQDVVEFLISKEPALFFVVDDSGLTAMQHIAKTVKAGQFDMLNWLYGKTKTFPEFFNDQKEFNNVYTVASQDAKKFLANKRLLESAKTNKIDGILNAIEKGADINCKASDGETALYKAVYNGYKDIAQLLIENGADPTIRNNKDNQEISKQNQTVLDMAKTAKKEDLVSLLVTPFLIFAANHGVQDDMLCALEAGAKINGTDNKGQTALHKAVLAGHIDVIKWLLRKHAEAKLDIHLADKDGNTPYHLAVQSNFKIKTKTGEKSLAIYLLEKFGSYKKEVKLNEKAKLANLPHSFVASVSQNRVDNNQNVTPDFFNDFQDLSVRFSPGGRSCP